MTQAIKRIPVLGWFGVALLAFSVGCVLWVMHAKADNGNPLPVTTSPGKVMKAAGCYGYVDIEPGIAKLYTLQPGRVVKVLAHDNDFIDKEGAELVLLDDTLAQTDLARAKVALQVAENDQAKADFLPKEHEEKIAGQKAVIAAKRHELKAAEQKRDEARRMSDKGGLGVSKETAAAAEESVKALTKAIEAEEAKLRGLEAYEPLVSRDVSSAEEQVKEKQELVKKAEFALRQCTVRAPAKGTVLRVSVAVGDVLGPSPREAAVLFCPDQPRIIRAEIEQEFANRLFLNQTAIVRDDSTNSTPLHGKVTRISDWFSHRRSMVQEPLQFNDVRTLECIITLDEKAALRIGQRMRVTLEAGN